jgi:DNA-directed RNA polymerase II subunit RPB2
MEDEGFDLGLGEGAGAGAGAAALLAPPVEELVSAQESRELARTLVDRYFRTTDYPYTRHHIDSYDQFLQKDMVNIIKSKNPITILKEKIPDHKEYMYTAKIYVGGEDGTDIEIGTPTVSLQNTQEVRLLFPNEARLRNLTYQSTVYAKIKVIIEYRGLDAGKIKVYPPIEVSFDSFPLFRMPIMLHSRYCLLHDKPAEFLRQAGECPHDNGGYFIVEGAEKILITKQEQAFNTLYITPQPADAKIKHYASISCLNPKTRQVKRMTFAYMRKTDSIHVGLPFVRKSVPVFVMFRALGYQSDEEILRLIFPDFDSPEASVLMEKLQPSIIDAYPFTSTHTAIQYMKTLTKGFGEAHVLDILRNQTFIHMPNDAASQAVFLADCVRRILRVNEGFDEKTDRDDTRNQRCLVSGFLIQMLFNNAYNLWIKASSLTIEREYEMNKNTLYKDYRFHEIFQDVNAPRIFEQTRLTETIMRGFKGKWDSGLGEEKAGVMQSLSRLSYCDFMSHCRRVVLEFDTGMKLQGPRRLHASQYGYFCTHETPGGASIGIAKNMSILTAFSIATELKEISDWLMTKGRVFATASLTDAQRASYVPVFVNGGIFGYTARPQLLTYVLRLFKRSGYLPYSCSVTFSIRDRRVQLYLDDGRPLRPLITLTDAKLPMRKLQGLKTWRDLVMGAPIEGQPARGLASTTFVDPLPDRPAASLEDYVEALKNRTGAIEYIDPYEQNEAFIANFPNQIVPETTHMEVHPSSILSLMTSMIPFPHHNQAPRNQLSDSQSKQGVSMYATNWQNRFDNTAHVLCYGQSQLCRTMYANYLGDGKMPYGQNIVLAIATWSGYNQEDGIVFNYDALQRGAFRSIAYRSYEIYEEDDEMTKSRIRIGNPAKIPAWKDLKPGLDYTKLDDDGYIRVGEFCDENTVIVGGYRMDEMGKMGDASLTPQVWTRGRVEKIVVTVNNNGLRLVKVRVVQDRIPELGDKFCLTPDHEVLTESGWQPIKHVSCRDRVTQWNPVLCQQEWVYPTATHVFPQFKEDTLFVFTTESGAQQRVTPEHRMWAMPGSTYRFMQATKHKFENKDPFQFVMAKDLATFTDKGFLLTETGELDAIVSCRQETGYEGTVHCLSVPSQVFLVRRTGAGAATWTGNSNRHGQKGTIGAVLRGHDMPRTASGIVPDMIMNPHAIPSRMTIAQNIEQLFGKVAASMGGVADSTAFMNDGSPEPELGALLEKVGFERYGNEVMYNGATGEQIKAYIFIGPVYAMRLKHMVEDKWQARGKGRKEQMTHQPTGGRGQQGGLKIGEMDRDALLGHSISGFVRESYMQRSDGTKMALCTSCGTVPIYNPKLKIAVCSLCDGPVRYVGETANNLELLPPMSKPKSRIVEVEMPYATKVLGQELEAYTNICMRYITTAGIQRLQPLEYTVPADAQPPVKQPLLPPVSLPARVANMVVEEGPQMVPLELLQQAGAELQQAVAQDMDRRQVAMLSGVSEEGETTGEEDAAMPANEFDMDEEEGGILLPAAGNAAAMQLPTTGAAVALGLAPAPSRSSLSAPPAAPQQAVLPAALPGGPMTIAVDTSREAMANEGLGPGAGAGSNQVRSVNRSRMGGGGIPMVPARSEMAEDGSVVRLNAHPAISVRKLE